MNQAENIKQRAQKFLDSDNVTATLTKVMLAMLAIGGLLAVGAMAPNLIQLLGRYNRGRRYSSKQLYHAYNHLKRSGFIEVKIQRAGKTLVRLTKKGEQKLTNLDLDNLIIAKPKKWDGKWQVLMFDLPVRFRKAREALRWKIKDLGFLQLQKSVWVYPYPCIEELLFVAEFFGVTKYIEILTVEKVLRETELKKYFDL